MTEPFPTLDAAAALGLAILLWRTVLLSRDLRAVDRLHQRLVQLLSAGKLEGALRRCTRAARSTYARRARRILQPAHDAALEGRSDDAAAVVQRAAHLEQAALRRHLGSGRARDLIVLAVLLGAMLYGLRTGLGPWFAWMCGGGALLMVIGTLLRQRIATQIRRRTQALADLASQAAVQAASAAASREPSSLRNQPCPACGDAQLVVLQAHRSLGVLAPTGRRRRPRLATCFESLRVCPRCGYLEGRVDDPQPLLGQRTAP